ncbi:MAG: FkbM family methyltransferase [Nitrospirota bacterium]|nr:FkbM family methyltransferase [Nitrospirota bacterium]
MKMRKLLKNITHSFGIDVRRHAGNKYVWLQSQNIRTVLDIGANEGQFALELRQYLPDAAIHSFEPVRDAFCLLEKNLKGKRGHFLYNYALGEAAEAIPIRRNTFSPASSFLRSSELSKAAYPFLEEIAKEVVDVRKLDDVYPLLYQDRELMIKMDVQGYEDRVVRGGHSVFQQAKIVISEVCYQPLYEGQPLFADLYELFLGMGYHYCGNIEMTQHRRTGMPLFADAVFMRGD